MSQLTELPGETWHDIFFPPAPADVHEEVPATLTQAHHEDDGYELEREAGLLP